MNNGVTCRAGNAVCSMSVSPRDRVDRRGDCVSAMVPGLGGPVGKDYSLRPASLEFPVTLPAAFGFRAFSR